MDTAEKGSNKLERGYQCVLWGLFCFVCFQRTGLEPILFNIEIVTLTNKGKMC